MHENKLILADCLEWMQSQPDNAVDFTIGSPPYVYKGHRYRGGEDITWNVHRWIDWMLPIVSEAVRVTKGYVVFIANGAVRKGEYHPACEGLIFKIYQRRGDSIACERPVIWSKNAPPNRKGEWFKNGWEFCLAFKTPDTKPYFDWEAIAEPPKYKKGGDFRQRDAKGERRKGGSYPKGKLAMPGDLIRATVGGGQMGHKLAHKTEAPYPEKLIEPFVQACCPRGGIVFDPFCGSGTSAAVAKRFGRGYITIDNRQSQIDLATRRIVDTKAES